MHSGRSIAEFAEYVAASALFPLNRELFQHQLDAWSASRRGESVVVTTGTGSGKTECYLLPVFAHLVEESSRWRPAANRPQRGSLVEATGASSESHNACTTPGVGMFCVRCFSIR